jgi:hypothetical protein
VLTGPGGALLEPGEHDVVARFLPTDSGAPQGAGTATLVVGKASTSVTTGVTPTTVTATVTPVAPGSGTPSGTVELSVDGVAVGTVPLVGGVATLDHVVASGATRHVKAAYLGDSRFEPATGSTVRPDPSITATIDSRLPKNRFGWFRTPVRIGFVCQAPGAPLVEPCPETVRLRSDGEDQRVTRTIRTTDGGADRVTIRVSIDRVDPELRVVLTDRGRLRCVAHDALSGVRRCRVEATRTVGPDGNPVLRFRAVATDRAGNRAVLRGTRILR